MTLIGLRPRITILLLLTAIALFLSACGKQSAILPAADRTVQPQIRIQ